MYSDENPTFTLYSCEILISCSSLVQLASPPDPISVRPATPTTQWTTATRRRARGRSGTKWRRMRMRKKIWTTQITTRCFRSDRPPALCYYWLSRQLVFLVNVFMKYKTCSSSSLMAMQAACSPAGPMRKTTKRQMLSMRRWTRGWMKDAKKEGHCFTDLFSPVHVLPKSCTLFKIS